MNIALYAAHNTNGVEPSSRIALLNLVYNWFETRYIHTHDIYTEEENSIHALWCRHMKVPHDGLDFWMYYNFLIRHSIEWCEKLILLNSSVVVIRPLDELIRWCMGNESLFVWCCKSLIDIDPVKEYIESWFLTFKWTAVRDFYDYLMEYGVCMSKSDVIRVYELWLSDLFNNEKAAFTTRNTLTAIWWNLHGDDENTKWYNFSCSFAEPLLSVSTWVPFIKKTFDNYGAIAKYEEVIKYLARYFNDGNTSILRANMIIWL